MGPNVIDGTDGIRKVLNLTLAPSRYTVLDL